MTGGTCRRGLRRGRADRRGGALRRALIGLALLPALLLPACGSGGASEDAAAAAPAAPAGTAVPAETEAPAPAAGTELEVYFFKAGAADAILLTMTDAEKQGMLAAFSADPVQWSGAARMGIPAVAEGEPVPAPAVFTSFDAEEIGQTLAELALLARADGFTALRLVGLETFPEALAEAAEALFSEVMNDSGVIALREESGASGEASGDTDARVHALLVSMGAAGYLTYMQVSRDGLAALDTTPPPSILVEAVAYEKPLEPGEAAILLPESARAGESFEITAFGPADAMSAMLRDENGENLPIDDMLKENLGDSLRFTFTVTFDAPVTMPVGLYFMKTTGWEAEPAASAVLTVR